MEFDPVTAAGDARMEAFGAGEGAVEDTVHDAEDGGRGATAESEGQDGGDVKAGAR
jgi:hypothetical protein